jgi:TM2 domain-containing membrane protein YozV
VLGLIIYLSIGLFLFLLSFGVERFYLGVELQSPFPIKLLVTWLIFILLWPWAFPFYLYETKDQFKTKRKSKPNE